MMALTFDSTHDLDLGLCIFFHQGVGVEVWGSPKLLCSQPDLVGIVFNACLIALPISNETLYTSMWSTALEATTPIDVY